MYLTHILDPSILAAAAALLIVAGLLKILLQAVRNPLNKVPGPWHARFTNLPLKLAVITGRRMYYVDELHQKYGPYVRIAPSEVAVNEAAGFSEIHRFGTDFIKSPWYEEITQTKERPGIFVMSDPAMHAARRRLFARPFSRTFLLQHWQDTVRDMVRLVVGKIREHALQGEVDVMQWWTFFSMDVSGRLMYGHSFENLERGEVSDLYKLLTTRLMIEGIGAELPFIRTAAWLLQYLPFDTIASQFQGNDVLWGHGKRFLTSVKSSETSSNIFSNIAAQAEKGEKLDEEDVLFEASALIVAGTDTTAITLTYLVYSVLSRPQLQKQLEEEVASLSSDFTEADVEKLPLVNAVIEETLRLHGAAPGGLPRMVPRDGATLGGYYMPHNTTVHTQAYSLHRDASLFPEPLEFRPSRWLDGSVTPSAKKVFHPFGAGSRVCLGMHLAYMELRLATAEFFRECKGMRLAESVTKDSMAMENHFLIAPKGHELKVRL